MMKVKAAALYFTKCFFDGDESSAPKEFDGLNQRLTGDQVITAGANGAALSMSLMNQVSVAIERMVGSGLETGSISALNYASSLYTVPLLFVNSLVNVLFPALSDRAAQQQVAELFEVVTAGMRMMAIFLIPAMVLFIVQGEPLVRLLFQRGAFDHEATNRSSMALQIYATGILPFGINLWLARAFHSLGMMWKRAGIVFGALVLQVVLMLPLAQRLGYLGIAYGTSLSLFASAIAGYCVLHRETNWSLGRSMGVLVSKLALSSVIMVGGIYASVSVIRHLAGNGSASSECAQLAGACVGGVVAWLIGLWWVKVGEFQVVLQWMQERFGGLSWGNR